MLRHTVDSVSEKGPKHVEHRTSIAKLIPTATKRVLERFVKENSASE